MRRNTENTVRKIGKSSTGDVFMEVRGRVLQNNPLIVGDHVDSIRVGGFHPMAFSKDSVVNIREPLVNSAIQAEEFTVIDY